MRRLAGFGATIALVLSLVVVSPAQALAPSIHFTADALSTWQTNGTVWGLAAAQGRVFAGGDFTQVRPPGAAEGSSSGINRSRLVVLDAATGAPTNCVLNVARGAASAVVRAVTASPDRNTVYIGGLFDTVNGVARKNVAALDVASGVSQFWLTFARATRPRATLSKICSAVAVQTKVVPLAL